MVAGEAEAEWRRPAPTVEPPDPPARARYRTGWGGLIFLLNTAAEAGIPAILAGDGPLAARGSRWVLHRLVQAAGAAHPGRSGGPR